jgi:hypothetical protein
LTLNINSLGAKNVYLNGTATSATNFVTVGQVYTMGYDGTEIVLSQPVVFPGSVTAGSLLGSGTNPYINFPSNTLHSASSGDVWNNAGVLTANLGVQNFGVNTPVNNCGTTSTCGNTILAFPQIVTGNAPLVSGTPSTVTISGISPSFTSSSTYNCVVSAESAATGALLSVANVSGSSFTVTGPATVTTRINYICSGY